MATDINLEWESARDPVLVRDEQCLEQGIKASLFYDRDDTYWGNRNEIGLSRFLFEFVGGSSSLFTLRELGIAIKDFDGRLSLRENESSITAEGDQWRLFLKIDYRYGKSFVINQLIERVQNV